MAPARGFVVLRLVQLPLDASVAALSRHIGHLQEDGSWVLVITNRIPAEVLLRQLTGADWNRLVFIDTVSPVPPEPVPGIHIEHIAGPHLLELLHMRSRRIIARLPQPPHVIYYDAHALSMAVPRPVVEEMTRAMAMVSSTQTWTDVIVHDGARLPAWQTELYDELIPARCAECQQTRPLATLASL